MNKSIGEQYEDWCIHFRGIQHDTCKAGIDWRALTGGEQFGIATRMPCLKGNNSSVACASCHYPTPEETQAREEEFQQHMQRQSEDMALIGSLHEGQEGTSIVYVCQLCGRSERYTARTPTDIFRHIMVVHDLEDTDIRAATGQMASHMDATDWFQTDDKFTLLDGRELLIRSTRMKRRRADRAMWRDSTTKRR